MDRFGKRYSLEQLLYRSITFQSGLSEKHNAAVRVKLVSALVEAEVGRVSSVTTITSCKYYHFQPIIIYIIILARIF